MMRNYADVLAEQIKMVNIPPPIREYRFHPVRRWRFDFAWPGFYIAAEVDGGIWSNGRHVRGYGFHKDCEKINAAVEMGWRVFRYTIKMVDNGEAIAQLIRVFGLNGEQ